MAHGLSNQLGAPVEADIEDETHWPPWRQTQHPRLPPKRSVHGSVLVDSCEVMKNSWNLPTPAEQPLNIHLIYIYIYIYILFANICILKKKTI